MHTYVFKYVHLHVKSHVYVTFTLNFMEIQAHTIIFPCNFFFSTQFIFYVASQLLEIMIAERLAGMDR